jgi:DNA polymerase-3 subunit beta
VIKSFSDEGFTLALDAGQLREMIAQVELAAASDDSRPVLAGVLFRFEERALTLAAADGFRLAVRTGELSNESPDRLDIIVPAKSVRELSRIIGDLSEPVRIAVTPNRSQLLVKAGQTEFLTQLIEGTFPDYKQIIPKDFSTNVELGKDAFGAAVRRASYFARDNNDVIRLHVRPGDSDGDPGTVEVTANAVERGNSQSFIDAGVTGPELEVAFNARYLTDVLGVVKSGRVLLGLNGANQAGVVRVAGSDDYSHVIMPMVIGAS